MKILALISLLAVNTCLADIVTLKGGRCVEGEVISYGGIVKVKNCSSTLVFPRSQVVCIKRSYYKVHKGNPGNTNFGSEFGTRPRPVCNDYTIAPPAKIIVIPERQLPRYQQTRCWDLSARFYGRRTITYTPRIISSRPVKFYPTVRTHQNNSCKPKK